MTLKPPPTASPFKAVILAAGRGSRLSDHAAGEPKCLMKIGGLTIIERIITEAKEAGIEDFVIVTGYRKDAISLALDDGARLGVRIEYAYNERWSDLANGYSILAAREMLGERFVILMSDHIFESAMLRELLAAPLPDGGCVLLTDSRLDVVFDIDDATKVKTDGHGRIVMMSKSLADYDSIDTGMFLSTRGLIDALDDSMRENESSLTAANTRLAAKGLMRSQNLRSANAAWFDLDTPESLAHYQSGAFVIRR